MSRVCLDLFSGLGGFSAAFRESDEWHLVTIDLDPDDRFNPDVRADVMDLRPADLPDADVVLASPPCRTFSMANQPSPHWDGETPVSDDVREAVCLTFHAVGLIHALAPDYWFLENPRHGKMDAVLGAPTGYVTYCQYGLEWQKPTDLWGRHPPMEYRTCSPGADCHQRGEGGWDTGEKRKHVRDPAERAKVPHDLSLAVLNAVDDAYANPPPEQATLPLAVPDGGFTNDAERGDSP